MPTLSIRGLSDETAARLKEMAREHHLSVNAQVLEFVRQGLGLPGPESRRRRHTDLDHLAGTLSEDEAQALEEHLKAFEAVDPELWR